jgi:tetraacyldisaccharide 4'-kinase
LTRAADYYQILIGEESGVASAPRIPGGDTSGSRDPARGVWPATLRAMLRVASVPYAWATSLRNALYDNGWSKSHRAGVPVVSIGNLTLGGTGKTPCVEYVAALFYNLHRRVCILSRGYGSSGGLSDEALVLKANLPGVPHLQGADRVALAHTAIWNWSSEVLVLDDGFQHRRLARDLDVVLIDATRPWGHDYLFPRGLLRESRAGLRRAGIIALSRCDQVDDRKRGRLREAIAQFAPDAPIVETTHRPVEWVNVKGETIPLRELRGRPIAAFCGIGHPAAFRRTLADLDVSIESFRTFADHHPYTEKDIEGLDRWARQLPPGTFVIATQKDLVKVRRQELGGKPLWALRIRFRVDTGQEVFNRKLLGVLRSSAALSRGTLDL